MDLSWRGASISTTRHLINLEEFTECGIPL
jgi:hypothetical protein